MLLNDEWCRFFKDNNFLVGICSMGRSIATTYHRKNRGGHGTFARVTRRRTAATTRRGVNVLSVINDYNVALPRWRCTGIKEIGAHKFSPHVERVGPTAPTAFPAAAHPRR